ncbi:MAG: hypothetical protein KF858_11170 [Candidatus Sumerlaeia bacterium]|nr:hypothetical protein [Candidatus Sumerlaeia bacterium]
MIRIAHIVNPVQVKPTSDLFVAQPVTFEAMRRARAFAAGEVDVRLLTAQYPEDHPIVPKDFEATPDLERSIMDLGTWQVPRKLPLLRDILGRMAEAAPDADLYVYTNVDIAPMPAFYTAIARRYEQGLDAFVINRRTIEATPSNVADLSLMMAQAGQRHPGHDCFVFARAAWPQYVLGDVCIGINWVGRALILNLSAVAGNFREFKHDHLTFHLGDDQVWRSDRFADYVEHNRRETIRTLEGLEARLGPMATRPAVVPYLSGLPGDPRPTRRPSLGRRLRGALRGVLGADKPDRGE